MINFKQYIKNTLNEDYTVSWMKDGEPASKQELKVSDVQFSRAYRYLNVNSKSESEALHVMTKEIGIPEKFAKEIVSIVLQHDNSDAFFKAVNNRTDITELLNSGNLIKAVVSKYGIDPDLAVALLNYTPATQPVTGKGEAFLLLFAKDAKKGSGKEGGDVVVGSTHYEIKGQGARIRGQKGFGTTVAAITTLKSGLIKLAQKANIQIPADLGFSISKGKPGSINNLAPALIASGKVTREEIVKLYIDGFMKLYDNTQPSDYDWVNENIDQEGRMTENFIMSGFIFAIQYYTKQEHFDYLVSIVPTGTNAGNVTYISKNQILANDNITSYILPLDPRIGLTPGAGVQGGFFNIKPANA